MLYRWKKSGKVRSGKVTGNEDRAARGGSLFKTLLYINININNNNSINNNNNNICNDCNNKKTCARQYTRAVE